MIMNAIVLNTLTGAVSEYDGFDFQSITPTLAGSTLGLYELGGDTDLTAKIIATVTTGRTLWDSATKKLIDMVYFSMKGRGTSRLSVMGENTAYAYAFPVRASGESRCQPGRGLRENYYAFKYQNADGADFQIDMIEVKVGGSTTRRV